MSPHGVTKDIGDSVEIYLNPVLLEYPCRRSHLPSPFVFLEMSHCKESYPCDMLIPCLLTTTRNKLSKFPFFVS